MHISMGDYHSYLESAVTDMKKNEIISRIWQKDYRVWASQPTEITNRLGWLTLTDTVRAQTDFLTSFATNIKNSGFHHVVLLGMGGSSLGAEVLRQTYGSATGYPEFFVLDSTVPASVRGIAQAINLEHTLFIVSSKSGTTTETNLLYSYFENLVRSTTRISESGDNFIAITDSGTPLAKLAEEKKFRHIFFAPSDIGGRYSVLSFFGLVPAALMGIDIAVLLEHAARMCRDTMQQYPDNNIAAQLGAILGSLALQGRNKFTLITSPGINSFGLWVEQLIAESTGKDGKGIIPVIDEPLMPPSYYGDDRVFIYLRLQNDNNFPKDKMVKDIQDAGQPVLIIEMRDKMDLGAEFFRWEFATAVAAALLRVNPFNQPDVEATKAETENILKKTLDSGHPPEIALSLSPTTLLDKACSGDYLAILAYVQQNHEVDEATNMLRRKIIEKYHIATTSGYGPRYLHSTGQLHKGGPDSGLFLQITMKHQGDLEIPGKSYTFGTLVDAQAAGDLQILRSRGRRIALFHISDNVAELNKLISSI